MFYEYLEVHGEWYYFYKGKKVVDVVPHGIGTLLDLIHHFISRELSQGQNSAYLYTHLCYTFISLISTPIITEGIVQYMLCVKSLQTCFLISHKYFPNKPMSNHLYLWSTLSIELANSQYIFFTYLHTFWFKENRGGGGSFLSGDQAPDIYLVLSFCFDAALGLRRGATTHSTTLYWSERLWIFVL